MPGGVQTELHREAGKRRVGVFKCWRMPECACRWRKKPVESDRLKM